MEEDHIVSFHVLSKLPMTGTITTNTVGTLITKNMYITMDSNSSSISAIRVEFTCTSQTIQTRHALELASEVVMM